MVYEIKTALSRRYRERAVLRLRDRGLLKTPQIHHFYPSRHKVLMKLCA